jgi:hypothetical protein
VSKLLVVAIVLASVPARAEPAAIVRIGALAGYQQTDRSAWVFGPSLEVRTYRDFSIRGEAHLELGDIDDPFGPSNIRGGDGPHVNHVMFGPVWRPERYARHGLAVGASAGVLVMHSVFAGDHAGGHEFTKKPAAGAFVQTSRMFGPVSIGLQLRVDLSGSVPMGGPNGDDVTTSSARLNLAVEIPIRR